MAFNTNFTQTFTSSQIWRVPSLAIEGFRPLGLAVSVQCYGAGGNGGSSGLANGGGGGGGAFAQSNNLPVVEAENVQIQVGRGVPAFWRTNNTVRADFGKNGGNSGGFLGLQGGAAGAAGTAGNSVGQIRFSGAAGTAGGALGQGGAGGGGAGDSGNASGTTGGPTDGGNGGAGIPNGGGNDGQQGAVGRVAINYVREWIIDLEDEKLSGDSTSRELSRIAPEEIRLIQSLARRTLVKRTLDESIVYGDSQSRRSITRVNRDDLIRFALESRILSRDFEESKMIDDNARRTLVKRSLDEISKYADSQVTREIERTMVEELLSSDTSSRIIDRISTDSISLMDAITRSIFRELDDAVHYADLESFRNFTRVLTSDRNLIDSLKRSLDREIDDYRLIYDIAALRNTTRKLSDSLNFSDKLDRTIDRELTDSEVYNDLVNRSIDRFIEDDLILQDTTARNISREDSLSRLLVDIFARELSRSSFDGRLFDDVSIRSITRFLTDSKFFEDEQVLREFSRTLNDFEIFQDNLFRKLTREPEAEIQLLDDSYRAAQRRADFFGYGIDRELLLRHAHEWMNEAYGPYIQQVLRRIVEVTRESDDFEG